MEKELKMLKKRFKSWNVVADQLGVSRRQLSRYQNGDNIPMPVRKLILRILADAYTVTT